MIPANIICAECNRACAVEAMFGGQLSNRVKSRNVTELNIEYTANSTNGTESILNNGQASYSNLTFAIDVKNIYTLKKNSNGRFPK